MRILDDLSGHPGASMEYMVKSTLNTKWNEKKWSERVSVSNLHRELPRITVFTTIRV